MALTIEDGSIVEGAEAFASIAWVTSWMDKRALLAEWNELVPDLATKEAHAREATSYLASAYAWPGRLANVEQALPWPRAGAIINGVVHASGIVPDALRAAQAILMMERARGGPLLPSWTGAPVRRKSAGGGIGKEFAGAGDRPVRHFPEVDAVLKGWYVSGPLPAGGGVVRLVRA